MSDRASFSDYCNPGDTVFIQTWIKRKDEKKNDRTSSFMSSLKGTLSFKIFFNVRMDV